MLPSIYMCTCTPYVCLLYQSRSIDVDQQLLHRVQTLKPVVDLVIHDFFITMAICNTVVVSQRSHSGSNRKAKSTRFYEAESPDEYALVEVGHVTFTFHICANMLIYSGTPLKDTYYFPK